ncbi:MAG: endonuclease III, partial [Nitrospina sp.]|nr:endonuclease III [Nitrospina sp.]
MKTTDLPLALKFLRKTIKLWRVPVVTVISYHRNPFMVLVSCLLSLRTRDEITEAASKRLFALARSPKKLLHLDPEIVEGLIYPVSFYRKKPLTLYEICRS